MSQQWDQPIYPISENAEPANSTQNVADSLSALVNYCESIKFTGFERPRQYWQMSSFDETKASQLGQIRSSAEKFIKHNQVYLSRIYPKGTRVMSSNFDPIPLWLSGCQMVALNYQAQDKPLAFNRAMFRANGQCGYILKPEPLLMTDLKYNSVATNVSRLRAVKKLRIRLISGHHLPKSSGKIKGNVIQPYVRIIIRGHPVDENESTTEVVPKVRIFVSSEDISR